MKEEKSWLGWFIEDWDKYNRALVLLYYLYPFFMVGMLIYLAPLFITSVLSLLIDSVRFSTLKAICIIGIVIIIFVVGFFIQFLWNRKRPVKFEEEE